MSTDVKTDTRTEGECAASTPVFKLCQEGRENRRSGEREVGGGGSGVRNAQMRFQRYSISVSPTSL